MTVMATIRMTPITGLTARFSLSVSLGSIPIANKKPLIISITLKLWFKPTLNSFMGRFMDLLQAESKPDT
jgi:hypothetical protein